MKDGMTQMLCNKKRYLLILNAFVVLTMICCTGCGNKTAITTEKFSSTMQEKGFYITDVTEQFSAYEFVNAVTIATEPSGNYQIEFYDLADTENAIASFNTNKETFEQYKGSSSTESSVDVNNHSSYSLTSNGKYMCVSRIDNTMIYVDVPENFKKEVKEIIDKLGY